MNINNLNETELDQLIKQAQARIEELKREPWKPKAKETAWIVSGNGVIRRVNYYGIYHEAYLDMGMLFKTEAEAQLKADSMLARQRVRQWIARENAKLKWVADFSDREQHKCSLDYNHGTGLYMARYAGSIQILPIEDYFAPELRVKIREAFTTEELTLAYLGVRL